jgi:hypothetical protein
MRFLKKRFIDYENVGFELHFKKPVPNGAHVIEAFFRIWLDDRQSRGICPCPVKDVIVSMGPAADTAVVLCGWCCDKCLTDLKRELKTGMADIDRVVVGVDAGAYPAPDRHFVAVGPKSVTFEDGRIVPVGRFRIGRARVTLGHFESFTRKTGHATTAERAEDSFSFRRNEVIEGVRSRDRKNVPVNAVSFTDALAYCEWARVRLPTEAEWLAASVIDDRIFDRDAAHKFLFGDQGRFNTGRFPAAPADLGTEWVMGGAPPGQAVVRYGPHYIREVGWETHPCRLLCPVESYDLVTGFRVVEL